MTSLSSSAHGLEDSQPSSRSRFLLIAGIIFIAFNLRPAITSVGPLVPILREDIGISNFTAGLLTSIPLVSFSLFSLLAPKMGIRYGNHISIFLALLILGAGIVMRSVSFTVTIFAGTALVGVGIAICNVLLPAVIKLSFPKKVGLVTSLYTAMMTSFAALGSGISIPLSESLGLGWQLALAVWVILTILAAVIWIPQLKKDKKVSHKGPEAVKPRLSPSVWTSRLAWCVTLFMGLQSFLYFTLITWIPDVLQELGLTLSLAGWMLFVLQLLGIPGSFAAPILADKLRNQKPIVLGICILYFIGFSGLIFIPNFAVIVIGMVCLGIAQGAAISLALTILSLRSENAKQASLLSGMAQSFGYLLASVGPILMGYLYDIYNTWIPVLIVLFVVSVLIMTFGLKAGENRFIFQEKP